MHSGAPPDPDGDDDKDDNKEDKEDDDKMTGMTWMTRKAVGRYSTQQPASANKEGGLKMDLKGGCTRTDDARWRRREKRPRNNQPANRSKWEKRRQYGQEAVGH